MQLFILSAFIILLVLALTYAVLVFWLLVDAIIDREFGIHPRVGHVDSGQ